MQTWEFWSFTSGAQDDMDRLHPAKDPLWRWDHHQHFNFKTSPLILEYTTQTVEKWKLLKQDIHCVVQVVLLLSLPAASLLVHSGSAGATGHCMNTKNIFEQRSAGKPKI